MTLLARWERWRFKRSIRRLAREAALRDATASCGDCGAPLLAGWPYGVCEACDRCDGIGAPGEVVTLEQPDPWS
jgi:hypothetical protein